MPIDLSLEFLPDWLPDETLFSLASRYHRLTGHVAGRHTSQVLFGSARSGYQHDLPSGIDHFVRATNGRYGQSSQIIKARTLVPYYLAFKSRRVAMDTVAAMRSQRIGHLKYRLGILTSGARAHHPLRACDDCLKHDRSNYGVGYWHLGHQLPGVLVCTKHERVLRVSTLKSSGVRRFSYFLPDEFDAGLQEVDLPKQAQAKPLLQSLAKISIEVGRIGVCGRVKPDTFRCACDVALGQRGFLSEKAHVRQRMACGSFAEYFDSISTLAEFEAIPSDPKTIAYMLGRLHNQSARPPHPMRLIAVIAWLFGSFEEYSKTAKMLSGRNPSARDGKVSAALCTSAIDKRHKFLKLVRAGQAVSQAATRVGIDPAVGIGWAELDGIPVVRRPKRVRERLLEEVRRRLRSGETRQHISEELGLSVSSVSRVLYAEPRLASDWKERRETLKREAHRVSWTTIIRSHGHLGIRILRSMEPAVYAWLYRNDRAWLETQRDEVVTQRPRPTARVEWSKRDLKLEAELLEAIDLLASSGRRERISVGTLCQLVPDLKRRLGQTDRLPRTKRLLNRTLKRGDSRDSPDSLPFT